MGKIKHTKNELKKQKDDLKRFTRYLPMLLLKKKQLQMEMARILRAMEDLERKIEALKNSVYQWVDVFAEDVHMTDLVGIEKVHLLTGNIAGVDIPIFKNVDFKTRRYDLITTPLWVDYGIDAVKEMSVLKIQYRIMERQLKLLREELRITTQRLNLFEKIKIPQALENIRKIRIFLGDLQVASVVTGKIAKNKIQKKDRALI